MTSRPFRPLVAALLMVPFALGGATAAGATHRRAAVTPVGTWRWSDNDEALATPRNPHDLHVRARGHGRGLIARFGHGGWVPFTWRPARHTFVFTATRRVGPHGNRRLAVTYTGRVALVRGRWTATGRLRIASPGFPGRSSFTATRAG
ncbi:MAG: hypothetical protein U0Y82_00225 [Thermoleophilia bacterium]